MPLKGQTREFGVKCLGKLANCWVMTLRDRGSPKISHLEEHLALIQVIFRLNKSKLLSAEQKSN